MRNSINFVVKLFLMLGLLLATGCQSTPSSGLMGVGLGTMGSSLLGKRLGDEVSHVFLGPGVVNLMTSRVGNELDSAATQRQMQLMQQQSRRMGR